MPRELIHWSVLEDAFEKIPHDAVPELGRSFSEHKTLAMLGAMSFDAPYYYKFGGSDFEVAAEYLHGKHAENTFCPLIEALTALKREPDAKVRSACLAFFVGALSHAITDIVFHPMVFYFTGDYYDPDPLERTKARRKHRKLETFFEVWVRLLDPEKHEPTLQQLVNSNTRFLEPICRILALTFVPEASRSSFSGKTWLAAIKQQALLQRIFLATPLRVVMSLLQPLRPEKLGEINALFRIPRSRFPRILSQKLKFKNPVSGAECEHTLLELRDEASREFGFYLRRIELFMNGSLENAESIFEGKVGASLNFGLPGVITADARYYNTTVLGFLD